MLNFLITFGNQITRRFALKFLFLATITMLLLSSNVCLAVSFHTQNFEDGKGDWINYESELELISPGAGGSDQALELTDPDSISDDYSSGAYSFLGGSSSEFGWGWKSSLDVFIDLEDSQISTGEYGFDLSQAMYDTDGNHAQDNIFHVGAADPENNGSNDVYINASHNSSFENTPTKLTNSSQPYGSEEEPGEFIESGWYNFEFEFVPSTDKDDFVEVSFSVTDSDNNGFWSASWTTESYALDEAGGNGYMWITYSNAESLKIDNAQLSPVPEPTTWLLFGTGLLGLLAVGRKKIFNRGQA